MRLIGGRSAAARDRGELAPDTDADQLAFEIGAMLMAANFTYLTHGAGVLERARRGIARLLAR